LIEKITIEQSFPYSDPESAETVPGWKTILQPYGEPMIDQGKEFWAAQKNNVELKGIIKLKQYFPVLTNDKKFRVTCSQGIFDVSKIIEFRNVIPWRQELHLKKVN
jgi:hypothetical protein